jgi:hypothetical protein
MSEAVKGDKGKAPLSWVPRIAVEQEALAFKFGAVKYGKGNYQKGMEWSRLLDAALRHIYAFSDGENNDSESNLSHLAHARSNLAMLMVHVDKKLGKDDRDSSS